MMEISTRLFCLVAVALLGIVAAAALFLPSIIGAFKGAFKK